MSSKTNVLERNISLQNNTEELLELLKQSPVIMMITSGPDHRIKLVTPLFTTMMGGKLPSDFTGKRSIEALPELKNQGFFRVLDKVFHEGRVIKGNEVPLLIKDDVSNKIDQKYLNFIYQPYSNHQGSIAGIMVYAIDVSEQVKARLELEDMTGQLKEESRLLQYEISERSKVEIELDESTKHFRFMADTMPQLVWTTKSDGYHDYYNKRWYEYTGLTYEQTKDKGWSSVLHPDDYERAWKIWNHSLKTGDAYEVEYRFKRHDGEYRWFIGRALPMRDENGHITKWFGTCTDIHEQKLASDRAKFLSEASRITASSLDLKTILQNIAELIVPMMADWCVVTLKEAGILKTLTIKHIDEKKLALGQEIVKAFPYDINAKAGAGKVVRTGRSELYTKIDTKSLERVAKNTEHLEKLKTLNMHSVLIVPLKVMGRSIGALTLINNDTKKSFGKDDVDFIEEFSNRISVSVENARLFSEAREEIEKRKHAEDSVRKANEELESRVKIRTRELTEKNKALELLNSKFAKSNQELQDFAYVSSHDLQEPLRKINSFANLLCTKYGEQLPTDAKGYLEVIQRSSKRMSILISDLLSYSRVTTQAKPFSDIDLNILVNDVLSDFEITIHNKSAKVNVKELCTIQGDPTQVRILIQNLISNSLKYVQPEIRPEVQIYSKSTKNFCYIYVKDNGIGFNAKYADKIFAMFQRLHGRSEYEGTGIGLAVCKKIIERHQGSITAKSTEGFGSTFIIKLPKIQTNTSI